MNISPGTRARRLTDKRAGKRPVWVILLLIMAIMPFYSVAQASEFEGGLKMLTQRSFNTKIKGLELIVASSDKRTQQVLSELLEGRLYYLQRSKQVVFTDESDGDISAVDVLTLEPLAGVDKYDLKRIGINNQIRKKLKNWIAFLNVSHDDPDVREKAVYSMLDKLDPDMLASFQALSQTEKNKKVLKAIHVALALGTLRSGTPDEILAALPALKGQLFPAIKTNLLRLHEQTDNEAVKTEISRLLQGIESRLATCRFFETLFFGLSAGSILVLASIGLAITFGVIGVINMAHGELIMIGAYTAYVIQQALPNHIGVGILIAVPAAFIVSGAVGIVIERSIIRFLYGRPLETLLATFGLSLVLQQAVRSIFSPLNRAVATPDWMSGSLAINPALSLTMNRIVILVFCLLVFGALFAVMKKTSLGLQVRAVSQNRAMARAMGVKAARVDALTFGLGSGIAGVAGVALSQLTNVGPNLGQAYIIDSFMVVVFGGVGNLWGTLLAGLSLGTANKFIEPLSGAVLAKIIVLVFIILFIEKRPQGLFPQKGRAAG